jgi:putative SOS response-associated peptidase YedK
MCNLYSLTKGQAAIRDCFRTKHDRTGNLPLFPGIFPDQFAPIVRNGADGARNFRPARGRERRSTRWSHCGLREGR